MTQHFGMLVQEQETVARVAEPAELKTSAETEMLRILETSGYDSQLAIENAAEQKIEMSGLAPDIASLVQEAEKNTKPVRTVASAIDETVCFSRHPALRRIQSDRMKIQSFHQDKEKYYGQIMRSYKDMGGVETVKNQYSRQDTLQSISQKTYGTTLRWPEIYILNKDVIDHYDHIPPGASLETPVVNFAKHCSPEPAPMTGNPPRLTSNPEE